MCGICREKRAGAKHARARTPRCSRQRGGVYFTKHEIETLHAILEVAFHKEQASAQARACTSRGSRHRGDNG